VSGEPVFVVLSCARCGLESFHQISYVGIMLVEAQCATCGLTTGINHDLLYHTYLREFESRVRSKPRRVLKAATRSPKQFMLHLPIAVLTKPYKLGEELTSLHHTVRSGRP
jgi:hypothetical protein